MFVMLILIEISTVITTIFTSVKSFDHDFSHIAYQLFRILIIPVTTLVAAVTVYRLFFMPRRSNLVKSTGEANVQGGVDQLKKQHVKNVLFFGPVCLLSISMIALVVMVIVGPQRTSAFFALFVVWLASTGALGSVAFHVLNEIAVEDTSAQRIVMMRMVLGALFAVILGLPFAFEAFLRLGESVSSLMNPLSIEVSIMILLPFVIGFSSNLLVSILNRFVQSVQIFFGVREQTTESNLHRVRRNESASLGTLDKESSPS
jgi:hypothetical protein